MNNPWGIERVSQRDDGCFPAVVSMLTGIDYEVLPNVTVTFGRAIRGRDRIKVVDRKFDPNVFDGHECGINIICGPWEDVKRYYEFNYGIKLTIHRNQPSVPAGRVVDDGEHIIVHLPDDQCINPTADNDVSYFNVFNNVWITAEVVN